MPVLRLTNHDLVLMKRIAIDFQDYLFLLGEDLEQQDTVEKLVSNLREFEQIIERLRLLEDKSIRTELL